jgi:hypothetical protein
VGMQEVQLEEVPCQFVWNCRSRSRLLHQYKILSSYMSQAKVLPMSAQYLQL